MKFSYFPGCTMKGTAVDYEESMRETLAHLDIELEEIEDWNCCGASSAHMTNNTVDMGLTTRNLDIAQENGNPMMVTPCPGCYLRLRHADHKLKQDPKKYDRDSYEPGFEIGLVTGVLADDDMLETIRGKVKHPLTGMKIAAYYGCLSQRPPKITGAQNHEHPQNLDKILEATGADVVQWSHKTECCGGSLTVTRADIVRGLVRDISLAAQRGGAEAIVTDCAMCQANLESRQSDLVNADSSFKPLPVYFATEVLAAVMSDDGATKWSGKHLVPAQQLAKHIAGLKAEKQAAQTEKT